MDIVNQWKLADGGIHEQYIDSPNDDSYVLDELRDSSRAVPYVGGESAGQQLGMMCDPWMNLGIKMRCAPCVGDPEIMIGNTITLLRPDVPQPLKLDTGEARAAAREPLNGSDMMLSAGNVAESRDLEDASCMANPRAPYWADYIDGAQFYEHKPLYKTEGYELQEGSLGPAILGRTDVQQISPLAMPISSDIDSMSYMIQHQGMVPAPQPQTSSVQTPQLLHMVTDNQRRGSGENQGEDCSVSSPESSNVHSPSNPPNHMPELNRRLYPCNTCGKVFNRSYNQQQHVLIVHATVRKKGFKCTYENCTKSYYRSADLQRHKRTHFQSSVKFSCMACGKSFHRSDQLQKHIPCCRCAQKSQARPPQLQYPPNPAPSAQFPVQQQNAQYMHSPLSSHSASMVEWISDK